MLVLACCTCLVSGGGVAAEGIFKKEAPQEELDRMAGAIGAAALARA